MIPQANITAWRSVAPWPDDAQVEQDLALSRATCDLFSEQKLFGKIALRGGTSLQKLLIHPAHRYSEDIDLVQLDAEPIGDVIDVIRSVLDSWLGEPRRKRGPGTVTLIYRFDSEIQPIRPLRLKIEINTREHFSLLGMHGVKFVVDNPWFNSECIVQTFEPDELLATKLRALYQRRKSRDLFDLWLCLDRGLVNPKRLVDCFLEYMEREGNRISRAQFEQNLHEKASDAAFMDDIAPLLRPGIQYDSAVALNLVRQSLIEIIPGEPWQGDADS